MANTLKFGANEWATKDGSILAYNDENNNFKPLPFTFERGSVATVVGKDGLIKTVGANEPRVDYKDNTDGAMLLEPQRSNLVAYSQDLSNSNWVKISSTEIISNNSISPNGTQNADKVNASTSYNGILGFQDGFSVSSGSDYSVSFFAKKGNLRYLQLFHGGSQVVGNARTNFDLEDGIVTVSNSGHDASIEDYGNGWFRCIVSLETLSTNLQLYFNALKDANAARSAVSDFNEDDNIFIWGIQLEQGSYPTSLINTSGSAVTRLADECSQTPPSGIIGQTEGSFYAELNVNNIGSNFITSLDDGGASDFIILDTTGGGQLDLQVRSNSGSIDRLILGGVLNNGINKIAFCYKQGDYALYLNGVQQGTSTDTNFPNGTIQRFSLGGNLSYGILSNSIKETKLYNTRLSNSELATLTTI